MALTTVTAACRCPLCHDLLGSSTQGRLVRCKTCRTPYHRTCWRELGGCSTLGCTNRRRRRTFDPVVHPAEPAVESPRPAPRPLPTFNLDDLELAAPCSAAWDDMQGDDRARHCGQCEKTVFDLSEMSRAEGEALLTKNGVAPCVRLSRRHDGTVITGDCPEGLRLRFLRRLKRAGGLFGLLASALLVLWTQLLSYHETMGAPMQLEVAQDDQERDRLITWLLAAMEHDRPVTQEDHTALSSMTLEQLRRERERKLEQLVGRSITEGRRPPAAK